MLGQPSNLNLITIRATLKKLILYTNNTMNTKTLAGKRFMIAEDDLFLRNVITKKIELHGASVQAFTNGTDCLDAIKQQAPDLLLLDIQLPGLTGYEILQQLFDERITPDLPVIVISNSGQVVEIEKILQLGVRDYIIKANFEPDEVLTKISEALSIEVDTHIGEVALTINEVPPPLSVSGDVVKVLVVEDDPLLRNMLSVKLAKSHCPHMFSNDGLQALELATQFEPQVIVLDLMIPGKDGFTVLAELKAHATLASIPVVIFSNKSGDDEQAKAFALGASAYRVKAMTDLSELVNELRRLAKTV